MRDPTKPASALRKPRRFRLSALPRHRFAILFFLLLSVVVYPYAESSRFGYYAFRTLGSVIILLTVYAVAFRRHLVLLVFCLAVPALLQRILLPTSDSSIVAIVGRVLSVAFDLIVIVIIFRFVYSEDTTDDPSSETIFGALSLYLLLGFVFASIYGLIASLQPNAFYLDPVTNLHRIPDRFDFIYFSFGTMTELGAPGITAVSHEVRSVSLLEAVLGILYLAVLISRLMSAYRPAPLTREAPEEREATKRKEGPEELSRRR